MSWLSSAIKGDKSPLSPVVNFVRAPDRIVSSVLKGDIKKAASVFVNPLASSQATRDRTLRRAGGALAGAAGGFITGGPAGAVAGAVYGGVNARKGKGQLKDYGKSFGTSLLIGGAAGGAAGLAGYGQYGGMAGNFTSGILSKAPADMTTAEYINSVNLRSSAPGGGLWSTASKIGSTALNAVPSVLSQLTQPGYQADQVTQTYPDGMFPDQTYGGVGNSFAGTPGGGAFSQGTTSAANADTGLLTIGLLLAGVFLWR